MCSLLSSERWICMNPSCRVTESCPLVPCPHFAQWLALQPCAARSNLTSALEYSERERQRERDKCGFYVTGQLLLCMLQAEGAVTVYCCRLSWDYGDWRRLWAFCTAQRNVTHRFRCCLSPSENAIRIWKDALSMKLDRHPTLTPRHQLTRVVLCLKCPLIVATVHRAIGNQSINYWTFCASLNHIQSLFDSCPFNQ